MTYVTLGSIALACVSIGAFMWYRSARVQYAFVFLGLSLFTVPALLGRLPLPAIIIGLLLLITPMLHPSLGASGSFRNVVGLLLLITPILKPLFGYTADPFSVVGLLLLITPMLYPLLDERGTPTNVFRLLLLITPILYWFLGALVPSGYVGGLFLLVTPILYPLLTARGTSTKSEGPQCLSDYPFQLALASLTIGGLAFIVGVFGGFSRAAGWTNDLAELGIVLVFLAALSNITAFEAGCASLIRDKLFHWWLPFSFAGLFVAAFAAWFGVHL